MTANLQTVRLKPNPSGKDRTRYGGASATQLGAEWADLANVSDKRVDVAGVGLWHIAYDANGNGHWEKVTSFSKGIIQPGQIIRVHAGHGPVSALRPEDKEGADFHIFTDRDAYVWNNQDYGDCAGLFMEGDANPFDKACYDRDPPEGMVLDRVGDRLVAHAAVASRHY